MQDQSKGGMDSWVIHTFNSRQTLMYNLAHKELFLHNKNATNKTSVLRFNLVGLNVILSTLAGNKRVRALSSMGNKLDASFFKNNRVFIIYISNVLDM